MNGFKEKVVQEIIRLGKKNRNLRMPALVVVALFLVTYHSVRSFFLEFRYHPVRQRILVGILILSLLAGQIGIINVFAEAEGGDTESRMISAFIELPDDVREQTVPAGTALEELTLPDTLEAVIAVQESEEPLEDTEDEGEIPPEDTGKEGETPETETEEPSDGEGTDRPDEDGGTEETDGNGQDTQPEETELSNGAGNAQTAQETHTVTAPEYYAENVIEIKTLEKEKQEETPEIPEETETTENGRTDGTDTIVITGITWQSEPVYDGNSEGVYIFTPVLPEGYTLAEGVSLPEITVTVQDAAYGGEIELLMRPYDEETSSDIVYYLADSYDSYAWEIWTGGTGEEGEAGEEWEEIGEYEPELVVGKEEWYTYRFRCIMTKDGIRYTARAADDWQIDNFGIMTMAANSAASGQSDYMYYNNSGKRFNVKGIDNNTMIQTTFMDAGYRTASVVGGGSKLDWNGAGEVAMGNSLYGTRDISLVYNGRYAKITYTVENRGSASQSFQVGSSADVMIGNNDCAPVVGSANGLVMSGSPKNNYTFNLVASKVSTLWYGYWTKAYDNMFTNLADRSTPYDKDSGMAWSWSDTVAPGGTWSRYVLVGVGELPESPEVPTLTNQDPQLSPGTPTVFIGTAEPGNTVCIEVGGEEFSGTADDSGNFSVTVTPPQDLPEGETEVNYYAVSEDGGISDVETITATVVTAPSIVLTDTAVFVVEDSVLDETWYRSFISSSSGTVSYHASAVKTGTPGSYTVTYTATRTGYADAAATLTVTVLPLPLELSDVTADRVSGKDSFTLTASLLHTGEGTISETGFVWGIMQNPTVALNNGSKKTSPVIKTKGQTLTVTAEQIVDGVTYYGRAYVKTSDGNVYYSPQKSFSINGKSYGTFTIKYNGGDTKTFTVTRTGGTDGAQTVYFRTVNGSAIGGTHFTHQASTLTFAAGESSKQITITEKSVTATYNSKAATAYSNADRTYQVEIYRVDGGGMLGGTTSAMRTMAKSSNYAVDRNIYTNYVENTNSSWKGTVTDAGWASNPKMSLTMKPNSSSSAYGNATDYINNTAYAQAFYILMDVWEKDDGYQSIKFSTDNGYEDQWKFEIKPGDKGDSPRQNAHFPCDTITPSGWNSSSGVTNFDHQTSSSDMPYVGGEQYLSVPLSVQTMNITFDASGSGSDDWCYENVRMYRKPLDKREPQLLGVAPMADGTYKAGDKVTVSLIFDEIVDSTNSTLSSVSLNTTWGTFSYAGGADTNVLYFTGTVPSSAAGTLTVNGIINPSNIKDMCSASGTAAGGSGSVTVNVDTKEPAVSITNKTIANKTANATITATNADTLQYTWSQSNAMPVTGWLTGTSGQTVSTKQTSGTWYLHVLGTYNATGTTAYTKAAFDFSSSASGSLPELTLSADNSAWAKSRTITLTKTPSTATIKVKTPSGATSTVTGTSYTATENGTYTFTLTSGAETVVKSITVSKIDRTAPTAVITGPASLTQNENVILTVKSADAGGAGVKDVNGTWTRTVNGGTATTETATLTKNSDGTYSATTPGTAGNNYTYKLNVTVTDNAGNTGSAVSGTYTVNLKAPTVTVVKTGSSNKGDIYSYTVDAKGNTITAVQLPDGTITTALSGTFTLKAAGTYYVTVSDAAGHVVRSDAMTVAAGVDGDAPEVRLYQQNEDWTNEAVQIDVSIYEERDIASAVWKKEGADSNTAMTCSEEETSVYSGAFSVTKNGTYTVTVTDNSGNVGTDSITVFNIDTTAPVIGELSYNYKPKNLWDWLIGKESLIITVPVTEEGSGADEITYTVTPEGGSAENKTADIKNSLAKITVSVDFKGTIVINCTDKAKNTSPSVTVGTSGKGLIIEDNAPEITFGEYSAESGMTVTVRDDKENAISAGLASVTYKIEDSEEVSVQEDFTDSLKTGVSFTIKSDQIPFGRVEIVVKATDNAGNQTEQTVSITKQAAPALTLMDLTIDYRKETGKLPEDLGELEVYTNPSDPEGSMIPSNEDGSRPIVPGKPIYIRYPEKTDGGETTPASGSVKIDIPDRLAPPSPKQTAVTDTTVTVTNPVTGEEYVLVEKGQTPDWSDPNTTGQFEGLDPNTEYDLYVRKKATEDSFASEAVKTEVRTYVTIKEPVITGEGAGEDGNTASKPEAPDAGGGTVTFTGTYGEEYTPVIIVGGQEMNPGAEMTWDEGSGKGEWEYTHDIPDGAAEVEITVEFRKRTIAGLAVTPDALTIYADDAANVSMDALTAYLKENSSVQAAYDNKTKGAAQADYTTADSFVQKGAAYNYTVSASGKTKGITLTVKPVTAAATAPDALMQRQKDGGYTEAEVAAWLPAQATVTYTGVGYTARTESRTVTWNTGSIGTDFGAALGRKTVNGTVELPAWATGQNNVSIVIEFVDKTPLTDSQMTLSISGWAYGEQTAPKPQGSITATDTNPAYTYLYSADNGAAWVTAESLPKSAGGHIVPGEYRVKMTYTGDSYIGEKTASFTVTRKALDLLSGTLAVNDKNYDGTTDATLKEGGQPELSGVITGDTVMLDGTLSAVFTNKGPKKNIPVTVIGFELTGRDAGYYEFKNTTLTLYATINNADGTPPSGGNGGGGNSGGNGDGENGGGNGSDDSGNGNGDNGGSTPGDNSDPGTPAVTPPADTPQPAPGTEDSPDKETETQPTQTVQTSIAGGRIVVDDGTGFGDGSSAGSGNPADGGKIATGNVPGMADAGTTPKTSTLLALGDGAVIVTVVCEEQKCTAGVANTVAVANAVLSPEQIQLVNNGETIEVRIDVKDISETVSGQDKEVVESGLTEYQKEIPELTLGMYVDISMFIRIGEGDWDAVTSTEEPVEVIIGIPEELMEDGREFYIIRSHEGEYTILNDMDSDPDTITISTDLFSAYAIAYRQTDRDHVQGGNTKCGLCHICPTFLGICYFIWLAVIIAAILVIVLIVWRKKKDDDRKQAAEK